MQVRFFVINLISSNDPNARVYGAKANSERFERENYYFTLRELWKLIQRQYEKFSTTFQSISLRESRFYAGLRLIIKLVWHTFTFTETEIPRNGTHELPPIKNMTPRMSHIFVYV